MKSPAGCLARRSTIYQNMVDNNNNFQIILCCIEDEAGLKAATYLPNLYFKQLHCPLSQPAFFQNKLNDYLNRCTALVAIVTANAFSVPSFKLVLNQAMLKQKKIILLHDAQSCQKFPPSNVPEELKKIFDHIAIKLLEQHSCEAWTKIYERLSNDHKNACLFMYG